MASELAGSAGMFAQVVLGLLIAAGVSAVFGGGPEPNRD
jgi:hypothetical protein